MRTHVPLALAFAGVLSAGAFAGCGADVDPTVIDEETATAEDALYFNPESWVTIRKDLRRCVAPRCGGYFIDPVNARARERYVSGLEFDPRVLGFDEQTIADVREAPERDLVLRGYLGPAEPRFGTRPFVVVEAHRALPGVDASAGDSYYRVQSVRPPGCAIRHCERFVVTRLNTALAEEVHAIDLDDAILPHVDADWVRDRVLGHGAIVAGHVHRGPPLAVAVPKTLVASRVIVGLPALPGPCPLLRIACPPALVPTYDRNADRCPAFDRCVPEGECPRVTPPRCAEGYTLVSWRADNLMCVAFACDPAFSLR